MMLLLRSPSFPTKIRSPLFLRTKTPRFSSSPSSLKMSTAAIVEHVVLFNIRQGTQPEKIDAMMSGLRSLTSLDSVLHLTAGPIHNFRSSSPLHFTHLLHSRYSSRESLSEYSSHPDHVRVVKELGLPICDDIMAVDWEAELEGPVVMDSGAFRLTLVKVRSGLEGEETKKGVGGFLREVKESVPEIERVSFGENFSPARAKGFGFALMAFYKGVEVIEKLDMDADVELARKRKERVKDLVESLIVADYKIPEAAVTATASL